MLRLFIISMDLLVSLPLVMLLIVLLVSLTYMINLNNSYISLFSHELYAYARPLQTYVGSQYSLDYVIVCPKGYANISIYAPNILLSKDKINRSINNIFAGYVYFVPEQSGTENLILSYNALCNGAKYNGTLLLPTYTTYLAFENRSAGAGSFSIT
jgi:hypothetical protein